ncbi:MAG: REP-associated tyrosine transposase [Eubacterium sp.]
MPRQARQKSESGIYHIMIRGINKQQIFQENEDYQKFLNVVKDCKEISGFELFAYCLMSNHAHLLLKEGNENLDLIVKRIGSRYVYWYNTKYKRTGHLFQDRYKSEPINNDEYLLSAIRYIHQNPVKAGIVERCENYKYSSYNAYISNNGFVDSSEILEILPLSEFSRFHCESETNSHIDFYETKLVRLTDEEAKRIIEKISGCKTVEEYQKLPQKKQIGFISEFRSKNISIRQINRLTGLSIGIVRKY